MTILLVRHALAVPRKEWAGDDARRPLSSRGTRQAGALVEVLRQYRVDRVYSSPALRCVATVEPLARARRLTPRRVKSLAADRGAEAVEIVDRAEGVVLCGHGENLPDLLVALAGHLTDLPGDPPFAKGATWALDRRHGKVTAATYLPPPA